MIKLYRLFLRIRIQDNTKKKASCNSILNFRLIVRFGVKAVNSCHIGIQNSTSKLRFYPESSHELLLACSLLTTLKARLQSSMNGATVALVTVASASCSAPLTDWYEDDFFWKVCPRFNRWLQTAINTRHYKCSVLPIIDTICILLFSYHNLPQ